LILFGKEFIRLWIGTGFSDAAPVLLILTACYSIALAQNPGISLVYALKKHYLFAGASVIEGILNLALSIYLAPKYGIVGVAMGTAIPMLFIKIFVQPIYISRIIKISLAQYWSKIMPAVGIAVLVLFMSNYFSIDFINKSGYFALGLSALPIIALFVLSFLLTSLIGKQQKVQE
jgi:O-antigen/teichoic acid export membrane protein